jgi:hypothetical protein
LQLKYGDVSCSVALSLATNIADLLYEVKSATKMNSVQAHVPFLPAFGAEWRTASGRIGKLGSKPFKLSAREAGAWFEHNGWRVELPKDSVLIWPILPHNPYRKAGSAEPQEGRIVLTLPFSEKERRREVRIAILDN